MMRPEGATHLDILRGLLDATPGTTNAGGFITRDGLHVWCAWNGQVRTEIAGHVIPLGSWRELDGVVESYRAHVAGVGA